MMKLYKILVILSILLFQAPSLKCQELYSWIPQNLTPDDHLNKIQFIDSENGFISGTNGKFGKSTNGGYNWNVSSITLTEGDVREFFININIGWLLTYTGNIYYSSDGGSNWTLRNTSSVFPASDIFFINSSYGWTVGGGATRITKTTDGGISWNIQYTPISQNLSSVYFNNINDGWVVGEYGTIMRTTNGGTDWLTTTNNATEILKSVYFINNLGWVVGENGIILRSINNGQNWTTITTNFTSDFFAVYFIDENIGWIAGEGIILKTIDGGLNWEADLEDSYYRFKSIFFINSDIGWAAGSDGLLLKHLPFKLLKPNGGETFFINSSNEISWYSNVLSVTDIKIEYSIDDGVNWNIITNSVPVSDSIFNWNIPNNPSMECKIKITDVTNPAIYEISDDVFTIRAGIIRVPEDFPTIQGAINFAQSGDSIVVQPNIYYENIGINSNKNNISIVAIDTINETIIDGGQIFTTLGCGGNYNLIQGFVIMNGNASQAGGIYCTGQNEFKNMVVKNNTGTNAGGIYCNGDNVFKNVIIENNQGSGIRLGPNANVLMNNVTIRNNYATNGGGIYFEDGATATLNNVVVVSNDANGNGGGIYNGSYFLELNDLVVANNRALNGGNGGGIYSNVPLKLVNSFVCNNYTTPSGKGGGIFCGSLADIITSTISFNSSGNGGGIYINLVQANIERTTITNNYATIGNGIYRANQQDADITLSNFYKNSYAIFNNTTTYLVNAENNWWGHSSGPYHPTQNPTGQGDSVNLYVDITPFLTNPNLEAPPLPIQNLTANPSSSSSVILTWDNSPLTDIISYKIHYDTIKTNIFYKNIIDVGDTVEYELQNLTTNKRYYFSVTCYDFDGNESWFSDSVSAFISNPVYSEELENVHQYELYHNYPNPFNPTTIIKYAIPELKFVTLRVFDVLGNEIAVLVNEEKSTGNYKIEFDATSLPSGIYFYRIQAGDFIQTRKMVLMK